MSKFRNTLKSSLKVPNKSDTTFWKDSIKLFELQHFWYKIKIYKKGKLFKKGNKTESNGLYRVLSVYHVYFKQY